MEVEVGELGVVVKEGGFGSGWGGGVGGRG